MSSLVSLIIPVRDGERFLVEALTSAFEQDYEPFEVIVVDDGSVDGSVEIARRFPVAHLVSQPNAGPAAARNRGVELAAGAYLAFLDADDVLPPTKLTAQVRHLEEHPAVGYVLGRHEVMLDGVEAPSWLVRDPIYGDLDGIPSASAVIRTDAFRKVGGFDPSYRYGEFADLFVRLKAAGIEREIVDEIVLVRRLHGANLNYVERPTAHPMLRSLRAKLDRARGEQSTLKEANDG